jgi:hypothetical protein
MGTVAGTITVDGKPLEHGIISYVPADGAGEPITVEVRDGKYELQIVTGDKQVQISAPVVIGKRKESDAPDAPLVDITEESLPDKYHVKTELTFEVQAGANTKDWSVESKKAKR